MDTGELIQLATLISVIVGVIGIIVSIRAYRRQVSAQFILAYTRRFDELLQSLPRMTVARMLRSPLFRREWKTLAPIFAPDRAFCRYVEKVQRESESLAGGEAS